MQVAGPDESSTASESLSEAARAALPGALRAMLGAHSVLSMADVRTWLGSKAEAGAASEASRLIDKTLHQVRA